MRPPVKSTAQRSMCRSSHPFLVMNGDLLTDLQLGELMDFHVSRGGIATLALARRSVQIDFGVVHVDDEQRLTDWSEKTELSYLVSAGIYVSDSSVLAYIPDNEHFDLPQLGIQLVDAGE